MLQLLHNRSSNSFTVLSYFSSSFFIPDYSSKRFQYQDTGSMFLVTEVTVSLSHDTAVTVSSITNIPVYWIQDTLYRSIYHQVSVHNVIPKTPKDNNFETWLRTQLYPGTHPYTQRLTTYYDFSNFSNST